MKDNIGKALGLNPMDEVVSVAQEIEKTPSKNSADDFEYARENFYNVIEKGTRALEEMLDVAKASEHPRAYEVVSTIMKTLVDANKDLVAMSDKKAKAEEPAKLSPPGTINNNLFVGSTAELQKMLKDLRNNDNIG